MNVWTWIDLKDGQWFDIARGSRPDPNSLTSIKNVYISWISREYHFSAGTSDSVATIPFSSIEDAKKYAEHNL